MQKPKIITVVSLALLLCALPASAKKKNTPDASAAQKSSDEKKPVAASDRDLDAILTQLDRSSENFHSCEADFVWEQYQKVVDERDIQKGTVYFLHHDKDIHMAADVKTPEPKYLLFSDNKVRLYQPRIEQITEYDVGKKKAEFESFLVLGFGGRGHDLLSAFQVKNGGTETMEGVKVVKLDLVPKSAKVHNMFERITVWVDPARDVSLKQQFFEPSGDYRTATYSNFKMNQRISDDVFRLKTSGRTKIVRPQ